MSVSCRCVDSESEAYFSSKETIKFSHALVKEKPMRTVEGPVALQMSLKKILFACFNSEMLWFSEL